MTKQPTPVAAAVGDRCSFSFRCITLRIFDVAFAGSRQHILWRRPPPQRQVYSTLHHNLGCACSLHDVGFRIKLPKTLCKAAEDICLPPPPSLPKSNPSKFQMFWKSKTLLSRDEPVLCTSDAKGSIEPHDSLARREALEREAEYLREMIRVMKRSGWMEEQIQTEWTWERLVRRGVIPKPDGWRDL